MEKIIARFRGLKDGHSLEGWALIEGGAYLIIMCLRVGAHLRIVLLGGSLFNFLTLAQEKSRKIYISNTAQCFCIAPKSIFGTISVSLYLKARSLHFMSNLHFMT